MSSQQTTDTMAEDSIIKSETHKLFDTWNVWAHLPHDTDWSVNSYKKIYKVETVEDAISILEVMPDVLVTNCMLFIMRDGIAPMWEDPGNRQGGCFSYKVANKSVVGVWRQLAYVLMGETISEKESFASCVTGITISPKKNFCIIKIWMKNCNNQNPSIVTNKISGLTSQGCLFKKHAPEY